MTEVENPKFTLENVKKAVEKLKNLNTNKRYLIDQEILEIRLKKLENILNDDDKNKRLKAIYEISTLINAFYSTRMGNDRVWEVAKLINGKYIKPKDYQDKKDAIIKFIDTNKSKIKLTRKLVDNEKLNNNYELNNEFGAYSFLTKYFAITDRILNHACQYSEFPIYDRFVAEGIKNLNDEIKRKIKDENNKKLITGKNLIDYNKFFNIMVQLKESLNDESITLSSIDNFFWYRGKTMQDHYIPIIISAIKEGKIDVENYKNNAENNNEIRNNIDANDPYIKNYIYIAIKYYKQKNK